MKKRQNKKLNKVLWAVLAPIFAAIVGFGIYWTVNNWPTIQALFNGTQIYTHEQVQDAYNKGYLEGNEAEEEYSALIVEYQNAIDSLQVQKTELAAQVAQLSSSSGSQTAQIELLQAEIEELNQNIAYYELLLEAFVNSEGKIVTFYLDSAVFDVNLVVPGQPIGTLPTIESTENYVFNYWEVNGSQITSAFTVTSDVSVVANLTYYRTVTFIVDGEVASTQKLLENTNATIPTDPIKVGYTFNGWYLGDAAYNFEVAITQDIQLVASFSQINYKSVEVTTAEQFLATLDDATVTEIVVSGTFSFNYSLTINKNLVINGAVTRISGNIIYNGVVVINGTLNEYGNSSSATFNSNVVVNNGGILRLADSEKEFVETVTVNNGGSILFRHTTANFQKTVHAYSTACFIYDNAYGTSTITFVLGVDYEI